MKATVHDVGMGLIRQRGTTTGEPEFIAAYLIAEECRRDPNLGLTAGQRLDRPFAELCRALWQAIAAAMQPVTTQRDFVLAAD